MGICSSCCRGQSCYLLKTTVFLQAKNLQTTMALLMPYLDTDRSKDGLYEPALADSEREAVADLLNYLENVGLSIAKSTVLERLTIFLL